METIPYQPLGTYEILARYHLPQSIGFQYFVNARGHIVRQARASATKQAVVYYALGKEGPQPGFIYRVMRDCELRCICCTRPIRKHPKFTDAHFFGPGARKIPTKPIAFRQEGII